MIHTLDCISTLLFANATYKVALVSWSFSAAV